MCRSVSVVHARVLRGTIAVETQIRQHLLCVYLYTSVLVAGSALLRRSVARTQTAAGNRHPRVRRCGQGPWGQSLTGQTRVCVKA